LLSGTGIRWKPGVKILSCLTAHPSTLILQVRK
jgi:hypothetical protein